MKVLAQFLFIILLAAACRTTEVRAVPDVWPRISAVTVEEFEQKLKKLLSENPGADFFELAIPLSIYEEEDETCALGEAGVRAGFFLDTPDESFGGSRGQGPIGDYLTTDRYLVYFFRECVEVITVWANKPEYYSPAALLLWEARIPYTGGTSQGSYSLYVPLSCEEEAIRVLESLPAWYRAGSYSVEPSN